jgi:RND family efflux transporter MFP subunit
MSFHHFARSRRTVARLSLTAVVVLAASCADRQAGSAGAAAPIVAVAKVRRADLTRSVPVTAEFRPYEEIDVHAKVAGYVKSIIVDVGDRVTTGQLLATLEIPELQDEVDQADAAVRQSQSEIVRAKSDLDRAQSAHDVTQKAATRLSAVFAAQPGLVAQQEVDDVVGRDRVADAQVHTAIAAVATAEQQLQVSQANAAKLHALFEYSRITAPFDGVITKRYADTGSMIQAGTSSQTQAMPVVRLSRNGKLRLVIPVPESAVPSIHLGSVVAVRVPVLNRTFPGTVARFSDQVDLATRTMHTEVDVPNPSLELVPGMYAETTIIIGQRLGAIVAPVQAISRGDHTTVLVVGANHALEERQVELGLETPEDVEIVSGLAAGDLVVVGNRSQLLPGLVIQPKLIAPASEGGR